MKIIILVTLMIASGCAITQSTSLTAVDTTSINHPIVTAEASNYGFIHLEAFTNHERQHLTSKLASQCVSGKISNVEVISGTTDFFGLIQSYDVHATANCTGANK